MKQIPRIPPTSATKKIVKILGESIFPSFAHKNKAGRVKIAYPERKIVRSQYFANVKENVRENIKSFLTRKSKIND